MRVLYERPDARLEPAAMGFADLAARGLAVGDGAGPGRKAQLVAIPTTSGSGSEVTPFCSFLNEVRMGARGWGGGGVGSSGRGSAAGRRVGGRRAAPRCRKPLLPRATHTPGPAGHRRARGARR
jgi:hypothetical protein